MYGFTALALLISFLINKQKGKKSVKIGLKKVTKNLPIFINMIIFVSIMLYFVTDEVIIKYVGRGNMLEGLFFAITSGSITLMPGFIAYPLANVLLEKGVTYTVLAGFTNSLMLVGVLTYPIEKKYFGTKVTLIRNLIGIFLALIVAFVTGIFFGEVL